MIVSKTIALRPSLPSLLSVTAIDACGEFVLEPCAPRCQTFPEWTDRKFEYFESRFDGSGIRHGVVCIKPDVQKEPGFAGDGHGRRRVRVREDRSRKLRRKENLTAAQNTNA
jgi:hypothetical protein